MGTRERGRKGRRKSGKVGDRQKVVSGDLEGEEKVSIRAANSGAKSRCAIWDAWGCGIVSSLFQHVCSHRLHVLAAKPLPTYVSYLLFLVVLVCMLAATDLICFRLRTVCPCTVFAALEVYNAPYMMRVKVSGAQSGGDLLIPGRIGTD